MTNNMGVLQSTAGGAAAGTGISPGLGTVVGAGIGLLGGLFGNFSQNKANEQNISLQRETNELNAKLARENYQLQRDMLERNLLYASPMEQRRMLELAGYNPYDFVNGIGSKPVASSPTPQLPSMQSAQVQPVNSFASQLSLFGNQFADVYKTLQEGKNLQSDTIAKDIDNQTRLELNLQTLRNLGLDEEAKLLENEFNARTINGRIETVDLDNLLKEASKELTKEQKLEIAIRNKFSPYRNFWEVQNLVNTGKLLLEQGKTEITKQELNRSGVRKNDADALLQEVRSVYEPKVAKAQEDMYKEQGNMYRSQSNVNTATVGYLTSQRTGQLLQNYIIAWYGPRKASAEIKSINAVIDKVKHGNSLTDAEVEKVKRTYGILEQQRVNLEKQNDWYEVQQITNLMKAMSDITDSY